MVRLKECKCLRIVARTTLFQFHYGTIKSHGVLPNAQYGDNFNSTMVRLKDPGTTAVGMGLEDFNSTMVRLKGYRSRWFCTRSAIISIPLWYD